MRWTTPLLLSLAIVAPAVAGPGGERWGGHGRGEGRAFDPEAMEARMEARADRLAELLDLTDEQRAAAEALHASHRAQAEPLRDEMRQLGEELHGLLDAGSSDAEAVGAKVIRMHEVKAEMQASRQQLDEQFSALLTSEQQAAWAALKESRRGPEGRRGFHRGGRGGRGGPGGGPGFGPGPGGPPDAAGPLD